jgi:hypothetical protein
VIYAALGPVVGVTRYGAVYFKGRCAKTPLRRLLLGSGLTRPDVWTPTAAPPAAGGGIVAEGGELRGGTRAAAGAARKYNPDQSALIDMANRDKRTGITRGDAQAYKDLGKETGVPVRGPEVHPTRPHGKEPHIHVGPVDHIPVKPEKP